MLPPRRRCFSPPMQKPADPSPSTNQTHLGSGPERGWEGGVRGGAPLGAAVGLPQQPAGGRRGQPLWFGCHILLPAQQADTLAELQQLASN